MMRWNFGVCTTGLCNAVRRPKLRPKAETRPLFFDKTTVYCAVAIHTTFVSGKPMYRYGITLICVLCVVVPSHLFAQGMNNDYPLDSTDVAVAINMLGFHIFKFPVHTTVGKKVYLNYTTEKYENSKLVESYDNYKGLIKTLPQEMVMSMLPPLDTSESVVRLYWRDRVFMR